MQTMTETSSSISQNVFINCTDGRKETASESNKKTFSIDLKRSILPASFLNKMKLQQQITLQPPPPPMQIWREIEEIDLTLSPSDEENPIVTTLEMANPQNESKSVKAEEKSEMLKEEKTSQETIKAQPARSTFACLRNLGSTCYINCIIQVLRYTPGFASAIHRLAKNIQHFESLVLILI